MDWRGLRLAESKPMARHMWTYISRLPCFASASSSASTQNAASIVIDMRCATVANSDALASVFSASRICRRQTVNSPRLTPLRRATSDMFAFGSARSATIRAFSLTSNCATPAPGDQLHPLISSAFMHEGSFARPSSPPNHRTKIARYSSSTPRPRRSQARRHRCAGRATPA